jgi:hypothetical protein
LRVAELAATWNQRKRSVGPSGTPPPPLSLAAGRQRHAAGRPGVPSSAAGRSESNGLQIANAALRIADRLTG